MAQNYIIPRNNLSYQNEFGGCDVIIDVMRKHGMRGFVNSILGERHNRAEYDYYDGLMTWFLNLCCGGYCFEDIESTRERLIQHPRFLKLAPRYAAGMSPDTFSRMCKELKEESQTPNKESHKTETPKGKTKKTKKKTLLKSVFAQHEINCNPKMNTLLLKTNIKLGLLKRNYKYILDFDVSVFQSKISDCRKFYNGHGKRAYCPAMASINDIPVFIENRNGDTPSSWNLTETIDKILKFLSAEGIIVSTIRIDGAGYIKEFIQYANDNGLEYATRARRDKGNKESESIVDWDWEIENMRGGEVELAEKEIIMGGSLQRLVITHKIEDDSYWAIISNIRDVSKKKLCEFYNMRSGVNSVGEHIFRSLKHDFSCQYLPLRKFEYNTVFIGFAAVCHSIYKFLLRLFHKKIKGLSPQVHLVTFIRCFVKGKTEWRDGTLMLLDKIARMYERLSGFT